MLEAVELGKCDGPTAMRLPNHHAPGRALTPQTISRLLATAMHGAGLAESGHTLRHSFATLLLEAGEGRNLLAVSRLLGHARSRVTETVYTRAADVGAPETIRRLPDPRALQGSGGHA